MTVAELKDLIVNKLGIVKGCLHYDAIVEAVVFNYEYKPYRVDLYLNVTRLSGDVTDQSRQLEKLLRGEQWDGTGLPPVGTECEVMDKDHDHIWHRCKILAHINRKGLSCAVFESEPTVSCCTHKYFRPLHTERDKAVEQMIEFHRNTLGSHADSMRQLYDAIVAGKIDGLGKVG